MRLALAVLLALGALVAAAVPAPAAGPALDPLGTSAELVTAGVAFGDFTYPVEQGKRVTIRRHILDPGEVISWGTQPSTSVSVFQSGKLTNYPSCAAKQGWRAFPAYYVVRSEATETLSGVTVNDGMEPVELYTVISDAVGAPQRSEQLHRHGEDVVDPVVAAAGCPSGPAAEAVDLGSGVAMGGGGIDLVDHSQIAVYRYTLPPGYSSGWHLLPDPGFVVQTSGTATTWRDCADSVVQEPGRAYLLDAATTPQLVTNRSAAPAEYLAVLMNIPEGYPIDLPPTIPAPPPVGCLDSPLTY